ncbi:AraC family transcriptional regulator [Armatimonas sp.]|uniref:AraC family transcriptional regulator n=1 Tax=Armatimonas sp. TaxID=1872638 RepID=UPI00286AAEA2|nr:AraC family transcriptional regulator [Armatimonas sp.]
MSETQEDLRQTAAELTDTGIIGERTRERITHRPAGPAMVSRGLRVAGLSEAFSPYEMVRTRWQQGQVLVSYGGEGLAWVSGEWLPVPPGMAYLSPPSVPHAFRPRYPDVLWEFAWVIFTPDTELPWPECASLIRADPEPLHDAILGLWRESRAAAEAAHLAVWSELTLLQARRLLRGGARPERLRSVWDAVESNLAHPWTAPELSALACLSEGQLRVVCQQETGNSPLEQVTLLRMRHAGALLLSTEANIEQVAGAIGYANPFAFSTAFKRVMGVPPSHWRK